MCAVDEATAALTNVAHRAAEKAARTPPPSLHFAHHFPTSASAVFFRAGKTTGISLLGGGFRFPDPSPSVFPLPEVVLLSLSRQYFKKEVRELLLLLLSLMLIVLIMAKLESRAIFNRE